ncbi:DUF3341 domain-containing protein [Ensifer sp. LCM 4579]|uniref:DUF3341 domain-containing protein n=1 Tax=Ensifer sp. LCM 4579 TaxID=1848292 RepID=UPI0008D911A7|nr:DUF3341 domain-containing protein [Ensifer sp. LCM 4579]OHV80987.1 hypothetical protein LCM4579_21170 [Ensifer sp. LCM 4579]
MREPTPRTTVFGIMAEFDRPERLVEGARRAREAGFEQLDAYSPFPVEGLSKELGFRDRRVSWLTLAGGILGMTLGFWMQVYTNEDYSILIGGRPLLAVPAFMLITFELMVLFAVLFSIGGMLALNRLPRLHHPVFDVKAFDLAHTDRFFLMILASDRSFDRDETKAFLADLHPVGVHTVEHTEEPE